MVVLDRMCNHSDAELVLGHFITRIYKRMGIFDSDACQEDLSPPVNQESLTEKELIRAKIVKKGSGSQPARLMDDTGVIEGPPPDLEAADAEMKDAPQEPQRRRGHGGFDLTEIGATVQRIYDDQQSSRQAFDDYQRRMDQDMTWIGSQQAHTNYTLDYYQPVWDAQYQGREFVRPDPIPEFRPPPIHVPTYRQGGQSFFPMTAPGNMSPRPHDLGRSPRGPVQFGTIQGGHDAGGSSSFAPGFIAGSSSGYAGGDAGGSGGFAGGDCGGSGSGQEEERNWVTDIFGPSGLPYGYHGQQQ